MPQNLSLGINATRVATNKKIKFKKKRQKYSISFLFFFFSFFFFVLGVVFAVSAHVVHYNYQIFSLKRFCLHLSHTLKFVSFCLYCLLCCGVARVDLRCCLASQKLSSDVKLTPIKEYQN